jgi:hypothetical protein
MEPLAASLRKSVARIFGLTLLASLLSPPLFGAGVTVRLTGEPGGEGGRYSKALAEEWAQKTGNKVEYYWRPGDASTALQWCQQYWVAKSPDVDVFQIDVIWQGVAAPHAVDLKKYYREDRHQRAQHKRQHCWRRSWAGGGYPVMSLGRLAGRSRQALQ